MKGDKEKIRERVENPGRKVGREKRIRRLKIIMWEKSRKGREESKAMRQREIEKREAINDLGEG